MLWEAFVVGEEWISEHFFTTDSTKASFQSEVLALGDRWNGEDKDGHASPRARFAEVRGGIASALATAAENEGEDVTAKVHEPLRSALGWGGPGQTLTRSGPVTGVSSSSSTSGAQVVLVEARWTESLEELLDKQAPTLSEPYVVADDESHPIHAVPRLLSTLFVEEGGPAYAVVFAGRWVLVAERERWPEGRYLAIDLQLVADRNAQAKGAEIDRAVACLHADAFVEDAEGKVWWNRVFERSLEHTVSVSKDLRDGVRRSIEIIGNDVVERRRWKGLDPLPPEEAQPLAKQSLRYLYRILFLLFAEASPELEVLPVGALEYREGYSLDRLRDLVLTEIAHDEDASHGTHFFESLAVLFRMVDRGSPVAVETESTLPEGLDFQALKADLFRSSAIAHIDAVGLSDLALQRVLEKLLLTKPQKKTERGFISYAQLGINQLGAVYEGLMSYTGMFATEDLLEVAKDGDASKGSWVVPIERASTLDPKHLVMTEDELTGQPKPVKHEKGRFVYRLAGRERQQSASYYTPEVLTRFVVSQALEELLDQDGQVTSAEQILQLTVCEPALGSGAFAIEAVRQLADQYLTRRQKELGERIDAEDYATQLQRVKASIALHQVYGVDLNATAVEFAEISLWLDTMAPGLQAPWFGLHLRRGNSLIGCRRATFSRQQVESKSWLGDAPIDVPLGEDVGGSIHHFLLPAPGWGAAADAKEAKALAPEARHKLNSWAKSIRTAPTKQQITSLQNIARRVEVLWNFALRRLQIAEREARRPIKVWGRDRALDALDHAAVTREEIERKLHDPEGAYQRLRRVMDAWNGMWFWPLTDGLLDGATPPTLDQWISGLEAIVGKHSESRPRGRSAGAEAFELPSGWHDLGTAEELELGYASAHSIGEALNDHRWLRTTERIARKQGFFHWQLDFGPVFSASRGFDLQVGNPPWVRPDWDEQAALAEVDSWFALSTKPSVEEFQAKKKAALSTSSSEQDFIDTETTALSTRSAVSAPSQYPYLKGLRPDLYRCFIERSWQNMSATGTVGMIHLESHFTDEDAGVFRAENYRRLRRHWQFINELGLFEIQNQKRFGVSVFGISGQVGFLQAVSIYHPETLARSLVHDGTGPEPGIRDPNGNWDLRPHASRVMRVDAEVLESWHAVLEDSGTPIHSTRMVYAVNRSTMRTLTKLSIAPRVKTLNLRYSAGWNETTDFNKGLIEKRWGTPASWNEVILQGPHLHVANPMYKSPNSTMRNQRDWTAVDLEKLAVDAVPTTSFKPSGSPMRYEAAYPRWEDGIPRDHFRIAWRRRADNVGMRTLFPALIPPGTALMLTVSSAASATSDFDTVLAAGSLSSLIADFAVRVAPKDDILFSTIQRLPLASGVLSDRIVLRTLRLNCLTRAYAPLWKSCYSSRFGTDQWTGGHARAARPELGDVDGAWDGNTPLRKAVDRRQALLEIDALVALAYEINLDELLTIYRTQFPVLYGSDRRSEYFTSAGESVPRDFAGHLHRGGVESPAAEGVISVHLKGYDERFIKLDHETILSEAYRRFVTERRDDQAGESAE